jgi:non-ribosomal peptide synthetase component F
LKGAPEVLRLPTDRPRPLIQGFCGARHEFTLNRELTSALRELSNRRDVTLFMTLLAAYNALLRSFTGQNDILVGTPVAGRERPGTEPMIGLFANILVLRTDLSGSPTFLDLLDRVRNTALEALAHQDIPFERLVDELEPNRSLSHNPLFQVAFVLDQPLAPPVRLRELTVQRLETRDKTAQFDLVLHMIDLGSKLFGSLQYNTELFDAGVTRLSRQFERMLSAIVDDPEIRLDEVDDLLHRFDLDEQREKEKRLSEASLAKLKNVRRRRVPLGASASDS